MITGFCVSPNEDEKVMFDYSGVVFPEGMITSDQNALFNHDQIERVDYLGLVDEEEKSFKAKLSELLNSPKEDDSVESLTNQINDLEIPMISQNNEVLETFDITN